MADRVVMVTGATRGLGRGIARGFASTGATIFVTGRDEGALASVVTEIAECGGRGMALACDHRDDAQAKAAFDRLAAETGGRLDILVNNAAAVYGQDLVAPGPFWEKPLKLVDMLDVGLRSNYVAAYHAAPLMVGARRGLIASISFYGAVSYFHGPAYGAAKAGTDKMTADMAVDLAPHGVSAVSFWPGFILTDAIKAMPTEMIPEQLRAMLPLWETPEFSALVIDALARDPDLAAMSGKAVIGAELGERYGIRDRDGKQPVSYRATMGSPLEFVGPPAG
ncbi:SDR family NAD(P)-dependent oxidoreductase [Sphingomonas sp. CGMCC 1.13654]|uniref:SDR family NAD(P)-dependent oxidoreductase n=1 Tax=Sphingomonas chungangi TaxID=2683589 RepID=A0A838L4Y0_9SPHN|nr:SDR family NAD(P)-dependent oxidoreductase [Sphingomonas chungangi]MBA2933642.1 SDR family NAD(P)-dependent oxidoreductase [Sphingomonas chungangi]MVW54974.1 SDR family NAD(P)-dependent oxidoreductase [Sphingomonas chungangi]